MSRTQRAEVHLVERDDEQQRDAGAGGVAGAEPQEVLPPDTRTATGCVSNAIAVAIRPLLMTK